MLEQDSKGKIFKQTFPSETFSIIVHIFAGIVLTLLILPFKSFLVLILIIPALLSLRGNISGPFIARTARDLIIGEFSARTWIENILATYFLSIITAAFIGILSIFLNFLLFKHLILPIEIIIAIPIISMLLTTSISIPCSTGLNYATFYYGLSPNNVVPPIMTATDDFLTIINFYITLLILGVP